MSLVLEKVLVTGGSGMVGSYADFGARPSQEELDITDTAAVTAFVEKFKPSALLHLAALTDMKYCEEFPTEALRVNAKVTGALAKAAASIGARFIYLSTNAVFDGDKTTPYDEDDIPAPVTEYGKSKLSGEEEVKRYVNDWLIVRTSRVFGGGKAADKRFVGKVIAQLAGPEIRAIADCLDTPTYAKDLMRAIKELMQEGRTGIVHVANSGVTSRFEQAKFIADFFGYRGRVTPVSLSDYSLIPPPLKNEALVSKTVRLRPWQDALQEYLQTEWK